MLNVFKESVPGMPRYYPGLLMADAMQYPRRLSIFGCVMKPESVQGAFQNR